MIHFVTYCVNIGEYKESTLINALKNLLNSIDKHIKDYHIIIYTNFKIIGIDHRNIEIRSYIQAKDNTFYKHSRWLTLSNNKLYSCRELKLETGIDYIWIDIDSLVTYDISYLNNYSNMFVTMNTHNKSQNPLFHENATIAVDRRLYICGSLFKLDDNTYEEIIEAYQNIKLQNLTPRFDLQDVFNYAFYHYHDKHSAHINGYNCLHDISYVWAWANNSRPKEKDLNNLYRLNGELMSKVNNKKIHILGWAMNDYQLVSQTAIDRVLEMRP